MRVAKKGVRKGRADEVQEVVEEAREQLEVYVQAVSTQTQDNKPMKRSQRQVVGE